MLTIGSDRAQRAQRAFAARERGWYVRGFYTKVVFAGPYPTREQADVERTAIGPTRGNEYSAYELVEREGVMPE